VELKRRRSLKHVLQNEWKNYNDGLNARPRVLSLGSYYPQNASKICFYIARMPI
jgi:hypothetical protein